jgi:hypothetical protein
MRNFFFFLVIAFCVLSSCVSTTSYVLKAKDRQYDQTFDSAKDTLVEVTRRNRNNKIDFRNCFKTYLPLILS